MRNTLTLKEVLIRGLEVTFGVWTQYYLDWRSLQEILTKCEPC